MAVALMERQCDVYTRKLAKTCKTTGLNLQLFLRSCFTCLSVFPSSAQGGDLLARRRHAAPFSYRRHYQQEGLPHPLHEHQVPGEPSYEEMTSHAHTVTLTFTMATRKVQHVPSSRTHRQMRTFVAICQPPEEDDTHVNICLPLRLHTGHRTLRWDRKNKDTIKNVGDVLMIE